MKKILLTFAVLPILAYSASAQRMTLHEEFTGENCGPCASTNPGFWTLINGGTNPSDLIHIAYMAPIPSAGWFYDRTSTLEGVRETYYSVPFAPYGRYDGHVPDATAASPGHPGYFTQADIDAETAIPDSFTMTCTNAWNATYDSIVTTVTVTATTAWSGGSSVYLRAALVQTDDFASPPGSNGETHFENVVQAMYPSATGTLMTGTWASGASHTYTITGAKPSFVDPSAGPYMVVWIQNDVNKVISQAAKGNPLPPIPNDAALVGAAMSMICRANGATSITHNVTLKNDGNNTLTSATIYYSLNGGTMASTPWSGTLAVGGTTSVAIPGVSATIAGPGYQVFYDSVASPNGFVDQNTANNATNTIFFVESTTAAGLPFSTSFETVDAGKFYASDNNGNGESWKDYWSGSATSLAHTDSFAYSFDCYDFAAGETEILTLPELATISASSMSFWTSHAPYSSPAEPDQLDVVYSTDCGSTWTSIWSKSGSALANEALTTSAWVPTSPSNYVQWTVSLSSVPTGSILAFKGTSGYGNYIWLDDVNVTMFPTSVASITENSLGMNVFPNPAKDEATLAFSLMAESNVQVSVVDGIGRTVANVVKDKYTQGNHTVSINTAAFASGVYNVLVQTDNGTFTQHLNIAK